MPFFTATSPGGQAMTESHDLQLTARASPVRRVLALLGPVKSSGNQHTAPCPAHDDARASLSVSQGEDGRVLIYCQAGCSLFAVLEALGLSERGLFAQKPGATGSRAPIEKVCPYRDERGTVLYEAVRTVPKGFFMRRPDGHGGHVSNLRGVRRVPDRLQQLIAAVSAGDWVVVVEGEKDADRLVADGFHATTSVGGAGKWRPQYSAHFQGARTAVIPDNDPIGHRHADYVAGALSAFAAKVVAVPLDGLPVGGDVSDWLDMGHRPEELQCLIEEALPW